MVSYSSDLATNHVYEFYLSGFGQVTSDSRLETLLKEGNQVYIGMKIKNASINKFVLTKMDFGTGADCSNPRVFASEI